MFFYCLKMKISVIMISTLCIFFEHLFWKQDQCNGANCTVRRISISERYEKLRKISSYIKYSWGVEDEIWITVETNMNWISIASFILLSALIVVVGSLYLSINSRAGELLGEKAICCGLPWFIQSSGSGRFAFSRVIIHPSPFCPSHSLRWMRLE